MDLTSRAEEILEAMWLQLEEGGRTACDVSLFSDDAALKELVKARCVTVSEEGAVLTPAGHHEAAECIRRHRLAERLLVDVLDIKQPLVHDASCRFEHLLHKGIDDSICTLLGHPRLCPHGKPIPDGRCCRESQSGIGKLIMPLSQLETNVKTSVAYLRTEDREALQKLIAMGLLPKARLVLLQRFPTLVIQLGKSQFAIDEELASNVFVRRS
jgi:DtxR family Mn-dependent transcriptional regulator